MPQENQTDWIEWQGGECPIKPGDFYEYVARDGFYCAKIAEPSDCRPIRWASDPDTPGWDIVRFRVFPA